MASKLTIRLALSLIAFLPFMLFSQSGHSVLFVYGNTTEFHTGIEMPLINIKIMQDDEEMLAIRSGHQGRYEVVLDLGHVYQFYFDREGFFGKNYIIDTTGMTNEQETAGFTFDVDISMIPMGNGLELPICEEPISIAKYDSDQDMLLFDAEMAERYSEAIDKALKSHMATPEPAEKAK